MKTSKVAACLIAMIVVALLPSLLNAKPPKASINLPCKVIEVVDGDTVTVQLTLKVRVRLIDCWAPESRTTDLAEKKIGIESKNNLKEIALNRNGILVIPIDDDVHRVDHLQSLSRWLGRIYIEDSPDDLSAIQVRDGYATKTKQPKVIEVDP